MVLTNDRKRNKVLVWFCGGFIYIFMCKSSAFEMMRNQRGKGKSFVLFRPATRMQN